MILCEHQGSQRLFGSAEWCSRCGSISWDGEPWAWPSLVTRLVEGFDWHSNTHLHAHETGIVVVRGARTKKPCKNISLLVNRRTIAASSADLAKRDDWFETIFGLPVMMKSRSRIDLLVDGAEIGWGDFQVLGKIVSYTDAALLSAELIS